ncbi:hypothetical protein ACFO1V_02140 [Daeguia caeni]|uniref:Uncharacterized protein n=1 Tax=Daeguia caeni TaxID=439612 RepID=A0ABV9H0R8_9HYPH
MVELVKSQRACFGYFCSRSSAFLSQTARWFGMSLYEGSIEHSIDSEHIRAYGMLYIPFGRPDTAICLPFRCHFIKSSDHAPIAASGKVGTGFPPETAENQYAGAIAFL